MKWWYTISLTFILGLVFVVIFLSPVNAVSTVDGELAVDNTFNYMPIITKPEIFTYFDDFSDPSSGWPIAEDEHVGTEYLNGEYRMLTKDAGYLYLLQAPTIAHETYTISVDGRWAEESGAGYGLVFGMNAEIEYFYAFLISPEFDQYWLMRGEQDDVEILDFGTIEPGLNMGSNHIRVMRRNELIRVIINESWERNWIDATFTGLSYTGLVAATSHDDGSSDVRFDNYLLTSPAFVTAKRVETDFVPNAGRNSKRNDISTIEKFMIPSAE